MATNVTLAGLIDDDREQKLFRVDRRVFLDPAIFEAELRSVFDKSWLYVGHESEIPGTGSFVKRKVGGRPVIFLRDTDGQVRAFFNTCTHRGNAICREANGSTKLFRCFYHGWSFDTKGNLVGVPDAEGYSKAFDRSKFGLAAPPRVESYRGLVFMSLDKNIVSLSEYLGEMKDYLDLMLDQADEIVVSPGQQKYHFRANWKLYVENSYDGYHGVPTHRRYFVDFLRDLGSDPKSWDGLSSPTNEENRAIELKYGHAVIENPLGEIPIKIGAKDFLAENRKRIEKNFGAERAHRMLDFSRNLFVFPNLILVAHFRAMRTFFPTATDQVEVDSWALVDKGEAPEMRRLRHDNFLSFQGPGGFATPDDIEALENCQRGFAAGEMQWSDISRGMERRPISTDELQMRTFWRRWYECVNPDYVAIPETERLRTRLQSS
jgi:p-cumate 2,3-dioxygenase subunit alpha